MRPEPPGDVFVHFEPVVIRLAIGQAQGAGIQFEQPVDRTACGERGLEWLAHELLERRRIAILEPTEDELGRCGHGGRAPQNEVRSTPREDVTHLILWI